jgi:hypothetical protein
MVRRHIKDLCCPQAMCHRDNHVLVHFPSFLQRVVGKGEKREHE